MQLIQLNLNHCRSAQDLLTQTVRKLGSDVAILSEPYRVESTNDWVTDRTGKAARGFVRANVGGIWIYSCYLAPSLSLRESTARNHHVTGCSPTKSKSLQPKVA